LLNATRQLFTDGFKFQLVIGGDGPLRGELEEQTRVLGLAKSVTFLGRLEDQVLPKAFAACDAFVLPTAELECFGIIALEALAAGRPVLATPVGAIPEIIRKIEPSWLTASPKAEDIAALIRRYLMGRLPEHTPTQLHDLVHRDYNRERILSDFIEATLGRNNHR
jgi:glycosyltransferase involved in cell wall biosynthesis